MPLPYYPVNNIKTHGYTVCVKALDRVYTDQEHGDFKIVELFFNSGELFEYTSTSGWFYELSVGEHKVVFEDSDFHDYFTIITKEEYRQYKLNELIK